jgi:hypothetical protein
MFTRGPPCLPLRASSVRSLCVLRTHFLQTTRRNSAPKDAETTTCCLSSTKNPWRPSSLTGIAGWDAWGKFTHSPRGTPKRPAKDDSHPSFSDAPVSHPDPTDPLMFQPPKLFTTGPKAVHTLWFETIAPGEMGRRGAVSWVCSKIRALTTLSASLLSHAKHTKKCAKSGRSISAFDFWLVKVPRGVARAAAYPSTKLPSVGRKLLESSRWTRTRPFTR